MNYVYLHGYASGPKSNKAVYFKKLFQKEKAKLYIPDLNGFDFSQMTLTSQMKIVEDILGHLKGPVTLIGSSMGGFLAAVLAEKHSRIKKLILMAPAFEFVSKQKKTIGIEQIENWQKNGFITIEHYYYKEKRNLNYSFFEDALQYEHVTFKRDLPVLIFHGLDDHTVPYEVSLEYCKRHPLSRLILLSSDHSLGSELKFIGNLSKNFIVWKG